MQQYTTEWAKEYLREHKDVIAVSQDGDLRVRGYVILLDDYFDNRYYCDYEYLPKMLEHPDGWQNSKVTREEL